MKETPFLTKPLYHQVRDFLALRILDGHWKPGQGIPNEIDLAKESGVSVGTMRKALGMLEDEGYLARRQGRGTFVADPARASERFDHLFLATGGRPDYDIRQVYCETVPATLEDIRYLQLALGDPVTISKQVVRINRIPRIYREARVTGSLPQQPDRTKVWDLFVTARQYGFWVASAVERITLVGASRPAAEALGVDEGRPLIVIDRVCSTLDGKPVEWLSSWSDFSGLYYETIV